MAHGARLIQAIRDLGVNPDQVAALYLSLSAGGPAKVEIHVPITDDQAAAFLECVNPGEDTVRTCLHQVRS